MNVRHGKLILQFRNFFVQGPDYVNCRLFFLFRIIFGAVKTEDDVALDVACRFCENIGLLNFLQWRIEAQLWNFHVLSPVLVDLFAHIWGQDRQVFLLHHQKGKINKKLPKKIL